MALITLNNISLVKGETSDVYEIFSKDSLKDYQAHFRISDSSRKELFKKKISGTDEIKNNDGIFNDALFYELTGKKYDLIDGVNEYNERDKQFNGQIKFTSLVRDELKETIKFEGIVFNSESEVIATPTPPRSDENSTSNPTFDDGDSKANGYRWYNSTTGELFTWSGTEWSGDKGTTIDIDGEKSNPINIVQTAPVDTPVANVEVTVKFISSEKEYSRTVKAVSDEDGTFRGEIFLGDTVRQEKGFGFTFSIPSAITEQLNRGRYVVTVVVEKYDGMGTCVFCKEVLQAKLDIDDKNVVN